MNKTLDCILLIDDDEATNFINEMIINRFEYAKKCVVAQSGLEALDYLKSTDKEKYPQPDLILLDINMPAMNGWEFLDAYNNLNKEQQGKVVIVMLTTSLNPDDKEKANGIDSVTDFMNKPMSSDTIQKVINKHFLEKEKN